MVQSPRSPPPPHQLLTAGLEEGQFLGRGGGPWKGYEVYAWSWGLSISDQPWRGGRGIEGPAQATKGRGVGGRHRRR